MNADLLAFSILIRRTETGNDTLDLRSRTAKVDEQADVQAGSPKVVHALGRMYLLECPGRLEFHNKATLDEKVRGELADRNTAIENAERELLLHRQSTISKLDGKSILVNLFKESDTQRIADTVNGTNDCPSKLINTQSAFIGVHRRRFTATRARRRTSRRPPR
jgi:hypothetical protein